MFSTFTSRLAQTLSFLLHPLLIPTLIFSLLTWYRSDLLTPFNTENAYFLLVFIFLGTFITPIFAIVFLYYSRFISSLLLDSQPDRIKSMIVSILIYVGMCWITCNQLRLNSFVITIMIQIIATMAVALVITVFWKISLHSTGAAGLAMFCAFLAERGFGNDVFYVFIGSIILGGILGSARLQLYKHNLSQVVAGYGLGLLAGGVGFLVDI